MSAITNLIEGAIDIHVHFAPDPRVERRADAIETARRAKELGMRALVLKSHEYSTAAVAYHVSQVVPGIDLIGAVSLDDEVGGLNPHAVEAAARMGARIVWMPTFSAEAYHQMQKRSGGITVLDAGGGLNEATRAVLEVVRAHDLVLATGHLAIAESRVLIPAARAMGIGRIVVTHISSLTRWYGATLKDQEDLVGLGAMLEHCVGTMMPGPRGVLPQDIAAMVAAVGAENCILSTDFGQWYNPIPPEGLRMGIGMLLQAGLPETSLEMMVTTNPARLLYRET